jgi:hypothetical protein
MPPQRTDASCAMPPIVTAALLAPAPQPEPGKRRNSAEPMQRCSR